MQEIVQETLPGFDYQSLSVEDRVLVQQRASEIKELVRNTAENVLRVGEKLTEVRARLARTGGNFQAWISTEFGWSRSATYQFINVFERFGSRPNFGQLNVALSALYILAAPSTSDEAVEEAVAMAEQGQPITHSTAKAIIAEHKPVPVEPMTSAFDEIEEVAPVSEPANSRPTINRLSTEPSPELRAAFAGVANPQSEEIEEVEGIVIEEPEIEVIAADPVQNTFGCAACKFHKTGLTNLFQFECEFLQVHQALQYRRNIGAACEWWKQNPDPTGNWEAKLTLTEQGIPVAALSVTRVEVIEYAKAAAQRMADKVISTLAGEEYLTSRWEQIQLMSGKLLDEVL